MTTAPRRSPRLHPKFLSPLTLADLPQLFGEGIRGRVLTWVFAPGSGKEKEIEADA